MKNMQKMNLEDLENVTVGTVLPGLLPTHFRPRYIPTTLVEPGDGDDDDGEGGGATGSW